jgi:hypothetical protein
MSLSVGPLPLSKSEESLGAGANTDDVSSGNHTVYMLWKSTLGNLLFKESYKLFQFLKHYENLS